VVVVGLGLSLAIVGCQKAPAENKDKMDDAKASGKMDDPQDGYRQNG
jgi:hypothetical protein